jgi:glycosyltransferase involved in cell wall biosynthesis
LEQLIARLGLGRRVTMTSRPREQLASVYRDADVCVFPSEWPEPFGIVPLEAMACETPVVATGAGGSGEYLLAGRNCLLFRAGEPASLVAALRTLASDPELRRRLVEGGRHTASSMTVDRLAAQLESVHDRATGAASGTLPTPAP